MVPVAAAWRHGPDHVSAVHWSFFFFVNLEPNLKKLAIFQTEMRASQAELDSWLERNGYRDNFFVRYGRWIGVVKQQPVLDPATSQIVPR